MGDNSRCITRGRGRGESLFNKFRGRPPPPHCFESTKMFGYSVTIWSAGRPNYFLRTVCPPSQSSDPSPMLIAYICVSCVNFIDPSMY